MKKYPNKLYKVENPNQEFDWDQFIGFVVSAPDEEAAREVVVEFFRADGSYREDWSEASVVLVAERSVVPAGVVHSSFRNG